MTLQFLTLLNNLYGKKVIYLEAIFLKIICYECKKIYNEVIVFFSIILLISNIGSPVNTPLELNNM